MLPHWGRDKMAANFLTTFSNAFSSMKIYKFQLRFHWSLFSRVWLNNFPALVQVTSHYLNQWWLVYWRIHASLGLNNLKIRRSCYHFIFNMGIPIPRKTVFILKLALNLPSEDAIRHISDTLVHMPVFLHMSQTDTYSKDQTYFSMSQPFSSWAGHPVPKTCPALEPPQ